MEKLIAAAEANRKFSELLRNVNAGRTYVITSRGKPVATIAPAKKQSDAVAAAAHALLLARLRDEPVTNIGRWTREELYER